MNRSKRTRNIRILVSSLLLTALLAVTAQPEAALAAQNEGGGEDGKQIVRKNEAGFRFRFTPAGLTSITLDDRTIAEGEWELWTEVAGDVTDRSVRETDDGAVRVRHEHEHATVEYRYSFDGEDVTISAYVTNRHPSDGFGTTRFGQLVFRFQGEHDPDQLTPSSKWGLLVSPRHRKDDAHLHPGWSNRIGGSYGADQTFGVGATPVYHGLTKTLLEWRGKWGADQRNLRYYAKKDLPPGASRTFTFRLRLSKNTDWKHLLAPYRKQLRALTGGQQYNADHRGVLFTKVSAGAHRTAENPYGFAHHHRLYSEAHTRDRAKDAAALMSKANMHGELIWANTGYVKRGCMFRTDFDIMPPEVTANWPIISKEYAKHNLEHGVCARSRQITYRVNWRGDNYMLRDPSDPQHVDALLQRYRNMGKLGATMFYLDAMGHRGLGDVRLVRRLRNELGPEAGLYVEHPTDMVMAYTGTWMMVKGAKKKKDRHYNIFWGLMDEWQIIRWLYEDPVALAHPRGVGRSHPDKNVHDAYAHFYRWCYRNQISPLPNQLKMEADRFRKLQAEFVTDDGQWK